MVEVELLAVRVEMPSNAPVVLLREVGGESRTVPIFIGSAEAVAISYALDGVETPRPMTHDLMVQLIADLGARLAAVEVTRLESGTFFAELVLEGGTPQRVSCRPSDGLALAARVGCMIRCAETVIDEAGYVESDEAAEVVADPDEVLEEFRDFIDSVDPEDFKG